MQVAALFDYASCNTSEDCRKITDVIRSGSVGLIFTICDNIKGFYSHGNYFTTKGDNNFALGEHIVAIFFLA